MLLLTANHNNVEQTQQKSESEVRMETFRNEYLELVKKYDIDFISYPQFVQTAEGTFTVAISMRMVDKKTLGAVPSPMAKDGKIIK